MNAWDILKRTRITPEGCYIWQGYVRPDGYGIITSGKKKLLAHRVSYGVCGKPFSTPLSDEDTLDHLCRNRSCVNPNHLEVVSRGENVLRGETISSMNAEKTHCIRGHEFNEENTRISRPKGRAPRRTCRACVREWKRVERACAGSTS